ncbi:MAG TPA: hypothetical protein VF037_03085 [Gemmatimonadales bacterium]
MYRIELSPGEEALFRNIDELAKAIHSGVIGSHARIWHGASAKWLPIDFHPHYKIAKERPVAGPAAPAPIVAPVEPRPAVSPFAPPAQTAPTAPAPAAATAPAPVKATAPAPAPVKPAPKTRDLDFIELGPVATAPEPPAPLFIEAGPASSAPLFIEPQHQAATPRHIEALVAVAEQHPAPVVEAHDEVLIDLGTPRRRINPRIAGIAAGVLLAAAAGGALLARGSAPDATPENQELAVASTSLAATPKPGFEIIPAAASDDPGVSFRGNRAAEPVPEPAEEKKDSAAPAAPAVPVAPSLSRASFKAGSDITAGMHDAQAELEGRLRAAGFTNLFAGSRLTAGTVSTTRLAVAGASGLVRSYRANASLEETPAGARTADALLADVDAVLGILAGQEGGYEIAGGTITFRDSASAREYGALRQRIATRIAASSAAGAPVAESLARALGTARLPALAE